MPDAAPDDLRLVAEHAPAMLWRARPGAGRDYLNAAWLAFTGRTLAAEIGDGWVEAVHPDDRDRCRSRFREALAAGAPFAIEYRLRHNDGSFRVVRDEGRPCGGGMIAGVCIEVGERPHEEGLRAALADAHHRTRNNLQVMLSLIGLYRRAYPESRSALDTLAGRIRAMDAVQHQLQDGAGRSIDVRDYLQRLASALAHAAGPGQPGVVVRGATFTISAKEASALGMIVAEASAPDPGASATAPAGLAVDIEGGGGRRVALLGDGVRENRPGPARRLVEAYAAKADIALSGEGAEAPPRLVLSFGASD